ncbi:hopanoid biosynthesis associated protein HpnK [Variovorax sp. PBL-H6]|nr:hopanoid biosynthesis associated protein HpnK [Variovorax sp. PBL-H6]
MTVDGDRFLCICADDFGMSEGVNAAVLALLGRSRICAASCMVLRGAWAAGSRALRAIDPSHGAEFGLHLEVGRPPSDSPAEPPLRNLLAASYLGLLRPGAVRDDVREQLARFEDALGRPPAFVDGHRHVHQLPVVREVLVEEIASRYGTAAAPWIRSTAPATHGGWTPTKADAIFALGGRRMIALAAEHRIPVSRRLLGVYGFDGSLEAYRERLADWIGNCRSGDVLLCHPALDRVPGDRIAAARQREYAALEALDFPVRTKRGSVFLRPLSLQPLAAAGPECSPLP